MVHLDRTFIEEGILILFGGGDGGGYRITPHGIHRIDPFGPAVFGQLKAVSALVQAQHSVPEGAIRNELGALTTRLSGEVVAETGRAAGTRGGLVYLDDVDGGFICGSTGQPPIPIPHRSSGSQTAVA